MRQAPRRFARNQFGAGLTESVILVFSRDMQERTRDVAQRLADR